MIKSNNEWFRRFFLVSERFQGTLKQDKPLQEVFRSFNILKISHSLRPIHLIKDLTTTHIEVGKVYQRVFILYQQNLDYI